MVPLKDLAPEILRGLSVPREALGWSGKAWDSADVAPPPSTGEFGRTGAGELSFLVLCVPQPLALNSGAP